MSTVIILTPIIISSWPAIAAAVTGAAAAMGLAVKESVKQSVAEQQVLEEVEQHQSVEIELEDSQILAQSITTDKEIVLSRGAVQLRITRDERGHCKVCASGKGLSKVELKQMAEEFTQKMTQCYVYNRVVTEVKNKGFEVVNEEMMEDEGVRINIRRWEE